MKTRNLPDSRRTASVHRSRDCRWQRILAVTFQDSGLQPIPIVHIDASPVRLLWRPGRKLQAAA